MASVSSSKGSSISRKPVASKDVQPPKPRNYGSHGVKDNDIFLLPSSDFQIMLALTMLALAVRVFKIYQPDSVVFDEVHFGGFASKYIKGKFFMDVHPPLAKLLITLAGWTAGFNGDFDFKDIGKDYVEPGVPYVAMRLLPALMGVATIPTMFLTLKATGCQTLTSAMGAALLIFENGFLTQSRLILLDSPLIIFTAMTALAFTCFTNQHEQGPSKAFDASWWFWLAATGLCLGATVTVKWVGLFTIAWVGSMTVLQLWVLLGDTRTVTTRIWFKHFLARVFCLICIPVAFYMALFAIHFVCLVNPGDGDGFMSSEFQATLNSKGMQDVPADVVMGSRVSIRHHNTQGGYLHSHNHMYPTGSKQQQITLYPHKDENNVWLLENQTQPIDAHNNTMNGTKAWDDMEPQYLKDGAVVRLFHTMSDRRLHSHDVRPPVTEADWQNEVSAYGYTGFDGDANDFFKVEIIKSLSDGAEARKRLRTIETKFRLVHLMTGCALFSHKVKLPAWGFEQQEVTCAKQGTLPNSVWYIEGNEHPKLGPDAEKVNYRKPSFLSKFWELQRVMWRTNAGLVESHAWDSRPASWPLLQRGINFWGKDHRQIYLIGNPLIWWSSTVAILAYIAFKGLSVLRWQRGFRDHDNVDFKRFDYEIGTSVLGWAFHYFPFYLMQRQLFLHHYFPALYFAIMTMAQGYDHVTARFAGLGVRERPAIGRGGIALFLAASIFVFQLYAPLSYGDPWTQAACKRVKLFDTWDWDCNTFYANISEYSSQSRTPSVAAVSTSAAAPVGQPDSKPDPKPDPKAHSKANEAVTPQAPPAAAAAADKDGVVREEKVEYRDQDGNILDAAQVQALAGKVDFSTRYETRTRYLDAQGREVVEAVKDVAEQKAPHQPEVERVPGTKEDGAAVAKGASVADASVSPKGAEKAGEAADGAKKKEPKPASDPQIATASGEKAKA